jgi:hypothetical protein
VSLLDALSFFIFTYLKAKIRLSHPSVTDEERATGRLGSKALGGHDGKAPAEEKFTANQDSGNVKERTMHGALGDEYVDNNLRNSDDVRNFSFSRGREPGAGSFQKERAHRPLEIIQGQQQQQKDDVAGLYDADETSTVRGRRFRPKVPYPIITRTAPDEVHPALRSEFDQAVKG